MGSVYELGHQLLKNMSVEKVRFVEACCLAFYLPVACRHTYQKV